MSDLKLVIGPKNYSSWSMRPWVLMRALGIPFEEVALPFDSFEPGSRFKTQIARYSPTGRVPVLVDGDFSVWDSLAIAEYLAERFPEAGVWPADARARAHARSISAEMHSSFTALRDGFAMNVEARLSEIGEKLLHDSAALRADLARIFDMWSRLLDRHGGPFLFGAFGAADAFYAPVCCRLRTYGAPPPDACRGYVERMLAEPGVAAWIDGALSERQFVAFEEPYRTGR